MLQAMIDNVNKIDDVIKIENLCKTPIADVKYWLTTKQTKIAYVLYWLTTKNT